MFKKTLIAVAVIAALATPAFAHGVQQQPSLLGGLLGNVVNLNANVGGRSGLANVNASLLGGAVKTNVDVGQSNRHGGDLLNLGISLDGGVGNRPGRW